MPAPSLEKAKLLAERQTYGPVGEAARRKVAKG